MLQSLTQRAPHGREHDKRGARAPHSVNDVVALNHAAGIPGLSVLPGERIATMLTAGEEVIECMRVLARAELNIVGECLKHQGTFYEYDHYPNGDVYDDHSHAQYYYHAHRGAQGEHGHFHTFIRVKAIPAHIRPVAPPEDSDWPQGDEILSHLIAIAMDRQGVPIGLFTTNRWVTGENWFAAADVIELLDRFVIDHAYPSWPVNRWLGAMLVLFRPQIEDLLHQRDARLERWRQAHPDRDAFEDRDLEIMSQCSISIEEQIEALNRLNDEQPDTGR